ncbi:MAG: OB-fold nucleic acid binding domain-containing protein [Micropruina sp.]|nr:MAG: OB-fold nucleic acid binding domain-containing protein [Micropruina sp.]
MSNAELEDEARLRTAKAAGAHTLAECGDRSRGTFRGTISMLTMKPRSGTPWLEAEFTDGSGTVTLIWMGRRGIPGVVAGRELKVTGRISDVDGQRRIYNPHYELL